MCKLCTITARYPRIRQESVVFNLSQFALTVQPKVSTQKLSIQHQQSQGS